MSHADDVAAYKADRNRFSEVSRFTAAYFVAAYFIAAYSRQ